MGSCRGQPRARGRDRGACRARQNASARRARRSVRRTLNSREQCRFWKVRHFAVPPRRRTPHVRSSVSREMSIIMTSWIMRLRNPPVDPRGGKSSAHLRTFHAWHLVLAPAPGSSSIEGCLHCHPSHTSSLAARAAMGDTAHVDAPTFMTPLLNSPGYQCTLFPFLQSPDDNQPGCYTQWWHQFFVSVDKNGMPSCVCAPPRARQMRDHLVMTQQSHAPPFHAPPLETAFAIIICVRSSVRSAASAPHTRTLSPRLHPACCLTWASSPLPGLISPSASTRTSGPILAWRLPSAYPSWAPRGALMCTRSQRAAQTRNARCAGTLALRCALWATSTACVDARVRVALMPSFLFGSKCRGIWITGSSLVGAAIRVPRYRPLPNTNAPELLPANRATPTCTHHGPTDAPKRAGSVQRT